jgi:hypothetical protein
LLNLAQSRTEKLPDPEVDPVSVIYYAIYNEDIPELGTNGMKPGYHVGAIAVQDELNICKMGISGMHFRK